MIRRAALVALALTSLLSTTLGCSSDPASDADEDDSELRVGQPTWVQPRPRVFAREAIPSSVQSALPFAKGANGPHVEWLQQRLAAYGYIPASAIGNAAWGYGNFGPTTERMLSSFQAWNGLSAHGRLDAATADALSGKPPRTRGNKALLEGGVTIAGLTEAQKLAYLRGVFDLNNPGGVLFNTLPGGVNFVHIRGFSDGTAVQNVPNEYNDDLYALINDVSGKPTTLAVMRASTDYGDLMGELASGFGATSWDTRLGPVMGEQTYVRSGLLVTRPGRVIDYVFGQHVSGASGVNRGLALRDPGGANGNKAWVDYNHNGQIDGAEWLFPYGGRGNELITASGSNVHHGANDSNGPVGAWSAACHPLPTDGAYQLFTTILLRSGQVTEFQKTSTIDIRGVHRTAAMGNGDGGDILYAAGQGYAAVGDFQAGTGVMTGYPLVSKVRFPFAVVDSRSLPPLSTTASNVAWSCSTSSYLSDQYRTCSGGDLYVCEGTVPRKIGCAGRGCTARAPGEDDTCN